MENIKPHSEIALDKAEQRFCGLNNHQYSEHELQQELAESFQKLKVLPKTALLHLIQKNVLFVPSKL